ncbi:MAG: helix-turn-helix transcriptional regulator [Bacillota bacterium]|uniref:helix-turn-helix transcriptional regulator n=1 Tax=Desulfurispora thermophila TaxID=265470 RepID=UPI000381D424|nr:PAS domain-containing protein [Desulfurispora thermophila]
MVEGSRRENIHPILKSYLPLVEGLGRTLGRHVEVVLHDVSRTEASIIAIANGHVTGRGVGSPATDLLMEYIAADAERRVDSVLNYLTTARDGRKLKSSTFLIRDEKEQVIGALCINMDLTHLDMAKKFLEELAWTETDQSPESFPENVGDFLQIMLKKALSLVDRPVTLLSKEEKVKVVQYLDKNKVFNIKGAVDIVARELGVSRYTIYNYLDEINAGNI